MDKQITCIDCKNPFVFSERDQAFFAEQNFTEPKRCKPCREAKKARQANGQTRERKAR